jgi:hypothetical protein
MPTTHTEILGQLYAGSGFFLVVSICESQSLPSSFVVRLTHTGDYNNDFHDVRVVLSSPNTPQDPFTHANGVSMNLMSPKFEILANHIARTMTVEMRFTEPPGSAFQVVEVWHGSVRLSLQQ